MIAIRNPHAVQRLAHRNLAVAVAAHEPAHLIADAPSLTVEEQAADALLSLENRGRYLAQSEATEVGNPAPIPPRPALWLVSATPINAADPSPLGQGLVGVAPISEESP